MGKSFGDTSIFGAVKKLLDRPPEAHFAQSLSDDMLLE